MLSFPAVSDGLCCQLSEPCPKVRPTVQFRELEVARESVKLVKKLGSGCFGDVHAGNYTPGKGLFRALQF